MKRTLLTLALSITVIGSHCQFQPRQITVRLTPAMRENSRFYYYDGNVVTFPALLLPTLTLNDRKINRNIKAIQTLRDVSRPVVMAGALYWFYNSGDPQFIIKHTQRFVGLIVGTTLFSWSSVITMAIRERRIINRYNELVLRPGDSLESHQVTFSLAPVIRKNGKTFFNGYRVRYENLMLPLMAVQDEQINRGIRTIQTVDRIRLYATVAPLLYFYYTLSYPKGAIGNIQTVRALSIGIVGMRELFNLTSAILKRRVINRYNKVVLLPSASLNPHGANLGLNVGF